MLFDLIKVRNQVMNDLSPSFVERLVPNRGCERDGSERVRFGLNLYYAVVVHILALAWGDEIHLMNQDVDARSRRKLGEGSYDRSVSEDVTLEVSGFNVEHIDEDSDIREDMLALL